MNRFYFWWLSLSLGANRLLVILWANFWLWYSRFRLLSSIIFRMLLWSFFLNLFIGPFNHLIVVFLWRDIIVISFICTSFDSVTTLTFIWFSILLSLDNLISQKITKMSQFLIITSFSGLLCLKISCSHLVNALIFSFHSSKYRTYFTNIRFCIILYTRQSIVISSNRWNIRLGINTFEFYCFIWVEW